MIRAYPRALTAVLLVLLSFGCKPSLVRSLVEDDSSASSSYAECETTNPLGGSFGGGDGSSTNPYTICSTAHFLQLNGFVTQGKYFKLTADIDLATLSAPINTGDGCVGFGCLMDAFKGDLDGDNHKLHDLNLAFTVEYEGGLFTYLHTANVHDLIIEDFAITGTVNIGGLLGGQSRNSIYTNITVQGTNTNSAFATQGGLIGMNDGNTFGNTFNNIQISNLDFTTTTAFVGGIIGYTDGAATITNSHLGTGSNSFTLGTITNFASGGFIGATGAMLATLNISDSIIHTGVTIQSDTSSGMSGGIVGQVVGSVNLTDVRNDATVRGSIAAGFIGDSQSITSTITRGKHAGVIGGFTAGDLVSGGFIGTCQGQCRIIESVNQGFVYTGSGDTAGGFIARVQPSGSFEIRNSYVNGSIESLFGTVGGLIGESTTTAGLIENSYVAAIWLSGGSAYALAAVLDPATTITGTVWDKTLNPLSSDPIPYYTFGYGYLSTEMINNANFTGLGLPGINWDFGTVWTQFPGQPPTLQWE